MEAGVAGALPGRHALAAPLARRRPSRAALVPAHRPSEAVVVVTDAVAARPAPPVCGALDVAADAVHAGRVARTRAAAVVRPVHAGQLAPFAHPVGRAKAHAPERARPVAVT